MSHLAQEEEFVESGQEFAEDAEELDDEASSTSAVLETFEISSNSMSTCSDVGTTVATVDDSSSSDTVKLVDVSDNGGLMPLPISRPAKGFFNPNKVYVINDEDDDDDDDNDDVDEDDVAPEIDADDDEEDDELTKELANKNSTLKMETDADVEVNDVDDVDDVSQIPLPSGSASKVVNEDEDEDEEEEEVVEATQTNNELIMQPNAAPIFLETPVIEEQQHHHHHHHHQHQHLHHEPHVAHHSHYPHAHPHPHPHHHHHLPYHAQHLPHHATTGGIYEPHMHCTDFVGAVPDYHQHMHQHHHHLPCTFAECLNDEAAAAAALDCPQQPPPPPPPLPQQQQQQQQSQSPSQPMAVYPLNFVEPFEHGMSVASNERVVCRLHQLNINNNNNNNNNGCIHHAQPEQPQHERLAALISNCPHQGAAAEVLPATHEYAGIDIESMDLLERRDFETEQRLTGGIIIKSSSNKNTLNLELIKQQQQQQQQQQQHHLDINHKSDNCKNQLNSQKCLSTDNANLQTTPTSSRNCTHRATKSNLKLEQNSSSSGTSSGSSNSNYLSQKMHTDEDATPAMEALVVEEDDDDDEPEPEAEEEDEVEELEEEDEDQQQKSYADDKTILKAKEKQQTIETATEGPTTSLAAAAAPTTTQPCAIMM